MEKEMETAQQELLENRTGREQDLQTSVNLLKTQIDEKFQEVQALNQLHAELLRQHHEYLARWIAQRKPQVPDTENSRVGFSENVCSANSSS